MVRLPDGIRDRIKAAADSNNRSMNAEIVAMLKEKYPQPQHFDYQVAIIRSHDIMLELSKIMGEMRKPEADKETLSKRYEALHKKHEGLFPPEIS